MAEDFGLQVNLEPMITTAKLQAAVKNAAKGAKFTIGSAEIASLKLKAGVESVPLKVKTVEVKKIDADAAIASLKTQLETIFGSLQTDSLKLSINDGQITAVYNKIEESAESASKKTQTISATLADAQSKLKTLDSQYSSVQKNLSKNSYAYSFNMSQIAEQYRTAHESLTKAIEEAKKGNVDAAQSALNTFDSQIDGFNQLVETANQIPSAVSKAQKAVSALETTYSKLNSVSGSGAADATKMTEFSQKIENVKTAMTNLSGATDSTFDGLNADLQTAIQEAQQFADAMSQSMQSVDMTTVNNQLASLKTYMSKNSWIESADGDAWGKLTQARLDLEGMQKAGTATKQAFQDIKDSISQAKAEVAGMDTGMDKTTVSAEKVANLLRQIQTYMSSNPGVMSNSSWANSLKEAEASLKQMQATGNATKEDLSKVTTSFANVRQEASAAGAEGNSFLGKIWAALQKIGGSSVLRQVFTYAAQACRELYEAVVDVDDAMTQLRIVTGATDSQMTTFFQNASSAALSLGASVSDVLDSIEVFSRLGYNLTESLDLSTAATTLANVADTTVDDATSGLTAIIKAYGLESSDAMTVADELTLVGQSYAVSASELMEALSTAGSTLEAGNNTLEQSIALIAAGNASIQNASTVGTALKTTSMRIRGATAELEEAGEEVDELCESTSKMRAEILSLSGVDIMIDDDTFKSTYDILLEIADVWDDMTDVSQAALLEDLAGKRNASTVKSVIANIQDMVGAYEDAGNAAGTATEANDIYLDSISGKLAQFSAQFQVFANTFLDSDLVKGLVDAGTSLLNVLTEIVETLGSFGTVAAGAGIVALVANFGNTNSYFALRGWESTAA